MYQKQCQKTRKVVNGLCSKPIPKGVISQLLYYNWWRTISSYSQVEGCLIYINVNADSEY